MCLYIANVLCCIWLICVTMEVLLELSCFLLHVYCISEFTFPLQDCFCGMTMEAALPPDMYIYCTFTSCYCISVCMLCFATRPE